MSLKNGQHLIQMYPHLLKKKDYSHIIHNKLKAMDLHFIQLNE